MGWFDKLSKEDQELFIVDVSARLHYGLKGVAADGSIRTMTVIYKSGTVIATDGGHNTSACGFKPILRKKNKIAELIDPKALTMLTDYELCDWYNANHIDYRGLIEKGLATEDTTGVYDK